MQKLSNTKEYVDVWHVTIYKLSPHLSATKFKNRLPVNLIVLKCGTALEFFSVPPPSFYISSKNKLIFQNI